MDATAGRQLRGLEIAARCKVVRQGPPQRSGRRGKAVAPLETRPGDPWRSSIVGRW